MKKVRTYALIGSALLHVIIFFVAVLLVVLNVFSRSTKLVETAEPIVLDLQDSAPRRLPNQVVETPDDAEITEAPERADYLSDKHARARDQEAPDNPATGKPFAIGDLFAAELPTPQGPIGDTDASAQDEKAGNDEQEGTPEREAEGNFPIRKNASDFRRDHLVRQNSPGTPRSSMRATYDNRASRALESGALSFNTYDWDFAPYMLWLKRRVEQNIFPPPAYTHMGIIEGETILRFRVYPDGEMRDLEVLKYQGHETLMETSYRAIEISAPFKKLPADFPEPYLEVTGSFKYLIPKRHR